MPSASVTRLYVEDGDVKCGEPAGRGKCGKVVLRDGEVIDRGGHTFSLAELVAAAKRAGQVTTDGLLRQIVELENLYCDLTPYRRFEGLVIIGPEQIEKVFFGPGGENPLGLPDGWCGAVAPPVPVEYSPEVMARVTEYCRLDSWQCVPALVLEPPKVAGKPTSLLQMRDWFGYLRDGYNSGTVWPGVHYSNWYCTGQYRKQKWTTMPTTNLWRWGVRYLPHPKWTTLKSYADQLEAAKDFPGVSVAKVTGEVWMMDILTALNRRYRESTWTRTATKFDDWPLEVFLDFYGVSVLQSYYPEFASGRIGLAVVGVWDLSA